MNHRVAPAVAWTLFALITLSLLYGFAQQVIRQTSGQGSPEDLGQGIIFAVVPFVYALVGALIISRQPRNTIGWLLMAPVLLFVINAFLPNVNNLAAPPVPTPLLFFFAVWFAGTGWLLLIIPVMLIPLLFPTGSPPSPRWRWVLYLALGMALFFLILVTFAQHYYPAEDDNPTWSLPNPIGLVSDDALQLIVGIPWTIALATLTILSLASVVYRYRHASAQERAQIKWLLYACVLFFIAYLPSNVFNTDPSGVLLALQNILFPLSILCFPIAIGIAILRYRLWDIDVIIRRTLTYALLTALLVIVFFGSVILLQQVFSQFLGSAGQNELITVLSTLAIAALFVPLRNRIQNAIDRRFNRNKYNAQQVLQSFGETVRDETDLEKLTGRLVEVVNETMQPRTVSVWLNSEETRK